MAGALPHPARPPMPPCRASLRSDTGVWEGKKCKGSSVLRRPAALRQPWLMPTSRPTLETPLPFSGYYLPSPFGIRVAEKAQQWQQILKGADSCTQDSYTGRQGQQPLVSPECHSGFSQA